MDKKNNNPAPENKDKNDLNNLKKLTHNSVLKKNIVINLLCKVLPIFVAVFAIPYIINGLGVEKFGILSIIWMIISQAGILDLGLGHALTQLISKKLGLNETEEIPAIAWTGLLVILVLGVAGSSVIFMVAEFITNNILRVSEAFAQETTLAFKILCVCLPAFILIAAMEGILASYQKFTRINLITVPLALLNYLSPVIVLQFTTNLAYVILTLVVIRFGALIAMFINCRLLIGQISGKIQFKKRILKPLVSFGSWLTLTNIMNPLLNLLERFVMTFMLTASVIAYFNTPYDVLKRLGVITFSFLQVMFPAFSFESASNKKRTQFLYIRVSLSILALIIIPVFVVFFFADQLISFWISEEFAQKSYRIAQVLALFMMINCLNPVPVEVIQSVGRSDITAKIKISQLIYYVPLFIYLVSGMGLLGAAIAMLIKICIEFMINTFIAFRILIVPDDVKVKQGLGANPG